MRTVSRSATRRIAELKDQLTRCRVYTLENYFRGRDVDPRLAWAALAANSHARLVDKEDGSFAVNVHDNCWYELKGNS